MQYCIHSTHQHTAGKLKTSICNRYSMCEDKMSHILIYKTCNMSACAQLSLINPNWICQCFYQPHISSESFQQRSRDQDSQKAISYLWFWTHWSSRNTGVSCGRIIRIHYHSYIHKMVTSNNFPTQLEKSFRPLKTFGIRFRNFINSFFSWQTWQPVLCSNIFWPVLMTTSSQV